MEFGLLLLLWFSMVGVVVSLIRKEWVGTWRGHRIAVRNYLLTEQLFIDDQVVASTPFGPRAGSVLTGSVDDHGQRVPVMASLTVGLGRLDVQLIVDGEIVPTTSGRIGALEAKVAPALIESAAEPTAPQWSAASKLLDSIRSHEAAPDLVALCDQVQAQLRQILLDIEDLDQDKEAHRLLATPDHDAGSEPTLDTVRASKEAQLRELLAAVQRLHLVILAGESSSDAASLAARLSARAEVEATTPDSEEKKAKTRAAQQAQLTRR
jgi:hypothetical protein